MDHFTIVLSSLLLFVASLGSFISLNVPVKSRAVYCGAVTLYIFMLLVYFISDYFTGEGINQATIYHLRYGLRGAGFTEYAHLVFYSGLILSLNFLLILYVFIKTKGRSQQYSKQFKHFFAYGLFVLALVLNPATLDAYKIYEESQRENQVGLDFYQYYKSSDLTKESLQGRNVVFIYLEGFERTYFDEQLFPGLVPNLKRLEASGTSFTNVGQTTNAGWTIAGMVASQCGLPLFSPSSGNTMSGMDQFLPEAVCLGDLLATEGYGLTFYGGADLKFAGKGKFYASHRFSEIKGLKELKGQLSDPDYVSDWGLYDDTLFDLGFERYLELSARDEKFGLFLLTLDTHHPVGHPSASCADQVYRDGTDSMLNAVACTDQLVSRFVARIMTSKYSDSTVIVLVSDHLALRNSATGQLSKGERRNLFLVIDPSQTQGEMIDRQGTTLDIGATLLPFIGYRGDIGLGRDLRSASVPLVQDPVGLNPQLFAWQAAIEEFWSFPQISRDMVVNVAARTVNIDGRAFGYPMLIRLNNQLATEMRFEFNLSPGQRNLRDELNHFDSSTPFIWVDECKETNAISSRNADRGVCLAIGRLDANPERRTLHGKVVAVDQTLAISAEEIREILFN